MIDKSLEISEMNYSVLATQALCIEDSLLNDDNFESLELIHPIFDLLANPGRTKGINSELFQSQLIWTLMKYVKRYMLDSSEKEEEK